MARQPQISDATFSKLKDIARDRGYNLEELQKVPQQWDE